SGGGRPGWRWSWCCPHRTACSARACPCRRCRRCRPRPSRPCRRSCHRCRWRWPYRRSRTRRCPTIRRTTRPSYPRSRPGPSRCRPRTVSPAARPTGRPSRWGRRRTWRRPRPSPRRRRRR
ncbi:PE family protein, partial [Streptomyces sp. adm13(2018)]